MPSSSTSSTNSTRVPSKRFRLGWVLALTVLAIGTFVGATLLAGRGERTRLEPRMTHTISREDLRVAVVEQGTLESSNNTEVKCKVRGFSMVTWVIPAGAIVDAGDELVRLDTKVAEEQLSLSKTNVDTARATLARTRANVEQARIAIEAYKQGRYLTQLKELEKGLEAAERNYRNASDMLDRSKSLFKRGFVTDLEVEASGFAHTQAELELKVKQTEIKVLKEFTKEMELERLQGDLTASESKLAADEAGLAMELKRKVRAEQELKDCVIVAERSGMVIYPSAAAWKRTPDITEGATVRKDQVLLLMPDLSKMQIKVGVHESVVDRVRSGLDATVTLPDRVLSATVSTVASVTRPAGWWTGNVVKYDTTIELPESEGLRPGMSAEVEIVLSNLEDVVTIPVAAVVNSDEGNFCWVQTEDGFQRRKLQLGESNDVFIEVNSGVKSGDQVALHPTAIIKEAEAEAAKSTASVLMDGEE